MKPIKITAKAPQPRPLSLSAPVGRWNAKAGDLDLDPRDSDFKLHVALILS